MSAITAETGYSLFNRATNSGASKAALCIEKLLTKHIYQLRTSAPRSKSFLELGEVEAQLGKCAKSADEANNLLAIIPLACRFLNTLPSYLPSPSVDLDPDGEVVFDWIFGRNRMLTITLGQYGRLSFAGILGPTSRVHGTEVFDDAIPEEIIRHINRAQPK